VSTLEHAAALLRRSTSPDGVGEILRELGFPEAPQALDPGAISELGLPTNLRSASVTSGTGALRAMVLELNDAVDLRETLSLVASALGRSSSQLLWLVLAARHCTQEVAIVCWRWAGSRARVASLICRAQHVLPSDAETLARLAAVGGESDLLTHARWLDVLGREAIAGRFFLTLEQTVNELASALTGRVDAAERRELALLYVSRLIFLSFLETKGWLDGDLSFLAGGYARCVENGGRYQRRVLEPLFFGTLNTRAANRSTRARGFGRIPFLNGGLFARSCLEKQRRGSLFSDESFGNAFGCLFSRYRFSGREDTADWSDASIDPEILGKAFEALMDANNRQRSGAFYTPQEMVEGLTARALDSVFRDSHSSSLDALSRLKILDPACGSGAFLVHILERLALLRRERGELGSISDIRRRVLTSSIFGVDVSPMAVWLCELRLWLSIVVESDESDPMLISPLPNLDRQIRIGDSLAGGSFDDRGSMANSRKLAGLRRSYTRAIGPRKITLARALDRLERAAAIDVLTRRKVRLGAERRETLLMLRGRDLFGLRHAPEPQTLQRLDGLRRAIRQVNQEMRDLRNGGALPFSFSAHFADIAASGGFDLVIGNPPWVRIHNIASLSRARLRRDFTVYRRAAWETGARTAGAGRGFAAQVDLAALFVERGCNLLRPGGTLGNLLPGKLWRSLAGGGVREFLLENTEIAGIEDLAAMPNQFDAAVYPSVVVARRKISLPAITDASEATAAPANGDPITITIRSAGATRTWKCPTHRLSIDGTVGSPWLLLPEPARESFEHIRRGGTAMGISRFGRPLLGVKTGCNNAYIVRVDSVDGDRARVSVGGRAGEIERWMLRPVVRGETLGHWGLCGNREYLVWTNCGDGAVMPDLPPLARRWLYPHRDTLVGRSDLHRRRQWWAVFRTEGARYDRPRVLWADFGQRPRAMAVAEGDNLVPLNTCYAVCCGKADDAYALAAILNGPLAAAWLNAIAEPARGGYRRYLGWTMAMLPLPMHWLAAQKILAPLGERGLQGESPSDDELLEAALEAYGFARDAVQPLLSWNTGHD
jgi:hypothetical protein